MNNPSPTSNSEAELDTILWDKAGFDLKAHPEAKAVLDAMLAQAEIKGAIAELERFNNSTWLKHSNAETLKKRIAQLKATEGKQ